MGDQESIDLSGQRQEEIPAGAVETPQDPEVRFRHALELAEAVAETCTAQMVDEETDRALYEHLALYSALKSFVVSFDRAADARRLFEILDRDDYLDDLPEGEAAAFLLHNRLSSLRDFHFNDAFVDDPYVGEEGEECERVSQGDLSDPFGNRWYLYLQILPAKTIEVMDKILDGWIVGESARRAVLAVTNSKINDFDREMQLRFEERLRVAISFQEELRALQREVQEKVRDHLTRFGLTKQINRLLELCQWLVKYHEADHAAHIAKAEGERGMINNLNVLHTNDEDEIENIYRSVPWRLNITKEGAYKNREDEERIKEAVSALHTEVERSLHQNELE